MEIRLLSEENKCQMIGILKFEPVENRKTVVIYERWFAGEPMTPIFLSLLTSF